MCVCVCMYVCVRVTKISKPITRMHTPAGHEDKFYNNRVIQLSSDGYAKYDCDCAPNCPQLHDNTIYTPSKGWEGMWRWWW